MTGLKLIIVLKIIQEHDGNFSITNKNKKTGVLSLIEIPLKNPNSRRSSLYPIKTAQISCYLASLRIGDTISPSNTL